MAQAELFETKQGEMDQGVPGFWMRRDYISAAEEHELLAQVETGSWETDWRRRIQQYGLGYSGDNGKSSWVRDLPERLLPLAGQVARDAGFERFPENCVINEYIPPL